MPDLEFTLNTDDLTLGDLEDLENASRVGEVRAWLEKHAGVKRDDFRALKVAQLWQLRDRIMTAVQDAALPKANGAHS